MCQEYVQPCACLWTKQFTRHCRRVRGRRSCQEPKTSPQALPERDMCEDCRPDSVSKDPRDVDVGFSKSRFPGANDFLPASPQGQGETARRSASRPLRDSPSRYASPEAEPFQGTWTAAAHAARARENLSYSYPALDEQQSGGKHWSTVMAPSGSTQTVTRDQRADAPSSSATAGYAYPPSRSQTDPDSRAPQQLPQSGPTGTAASAYPPRHQTDPSYGRAPQQPPQSGPTGPAGHANPPPQRQPAASSETARFLQRLGVTHDLARATRLYEAVLRAEAIHRFNQATRAPWTAAENALLLYLRDEDDREYPFIAEQMHYRSAGACRSQHERLSGQRR